MSVTEEEASVRSRESVDDLRTMRDAETKQADSYGWWTPGFLFQQSSMLHRRSRVCVHQRWDLPLELGGLLYEHSSQGLPNHNQGYPLGCKPPRLCTHLQNPNA